MGTKATIVKSAHLRSVVHSFPKSVTFVHDLSIGSGNTEKSLALSLTRACEQWLQSHIFCIPNTQSTVPSVYLTIKAAASLV